MDHSKTRKRYLSMLALTASTVIMATSGALTVLPAGAQSPDTADNVITDTDNVIADSSEAPRSLGNLNTIMGTTSNAADSGWTAHHPDDPTGQGWSFVEPITGEYHSNYFNIANARTQVPAIREPSASDLTWVNQSGEIDGVEMRVSTTESALTAIDNEWLTEGVDYINDRTTRDGITGGSNTVAIEFNAEARSEQRSLRIAAPGAGGNGFCTGESNIGISAIRQGNNACEFTIPANTPWLASRNLSQSLGAPARASMAIISNAGNALSRPLTRMTHVSYDTSISSATPTINSVTGEGRMTLRASGTRYSFELVIHAGTSLLERRSGEVMVGPHPSPVLR